MSGRLKATLIGLGCLICCLPLIFTIVGATSGLAGAASVWLGRYDLAIIGALGLVAVIAMAVRRNRAPSPPKAEHNPR
ncbi:MAG TPA: hypothetical protein VJ950_03350 [Acidimicrobiia bacterium]|nr:hypothetical protein [Acidimicrobiia bacterium]